DGPISITECSSTSACVQESVCTTRSNWQGINNLIREALEKVTLAEMIEPKPQIVKLNRSGGVFA
nr:Rrf2 family transcriptional regulator [Burkholderiales bacterium]